MASLKPIAKDQESKFQKYKFRGIDSCYATIQPELIKHGVFCCPQVLEQKHEVVETQDGKVQYHAILKISHKFYAEDGSFVDVITVGEGLDTSDKATNKATSGAMKYAFIEVFSIPTEDIDDSDRDSPQASKPRAAAPQIREVTEAKKQTNKDFF